MKQYKTEEVRNVAVVSHAGSGKTTLCEAMLFDSGAVDRLAKVTDGSSNFDFEPEEVKRGISIDMLRSTYVSIIFSIESLSSFMTCHESKSFFENF